MIRSNLNLGFVAGGWETGASMFSPVSRHQLPATKLLALHALNDIGHHLVSVFAPVVMPSGKLADIAVHVLFREVMEGDVIAAFQCGPERLHPVRMRLFPNILADAVVDALMRPVHAAVGGSVIRVDLRVRIGLFVHEAIQGFTVGRFDHACGDLIGLPVLCADHGGFPTAPQPAPSSRSCRRLALLMFFLLPPM